MGGLNKWVIHKLSPPSALYCHWNGLILAKTAVSRLGFQILDNRGERPESRQTYRPAPPRTIRSVLPSNTHTHTTNTGTCGYRGGACGEELQTWDLEEPRILLARAPRGFAEDDVPGTAHAAPPVTRSLIAILRRTTCSPTAALFPPHRPPSSTSAVVVVVRESWTRLPPVQMMESSR